MISVASGAIALLAHVVYTSHAAVYTASPGSLASCVAKLANPGDECRLAAGTYPPPTNDGQPGVTVAAKHGTASAPMIIGAAPGVAPSDVILDGTPVKKVCR